MINFISSIRVFVSLVATKRYIYDMQKDYLKSFEGSWSTSLFLSRRETFERTWYWECEHNFSRKVKTSIEFLQIIVSKEYKTASNPKKRKNTRQKEHSSQGIKSKWCILLQICWLLPCLVCACNKVDSRHCGSFLLEVPSGSNFILRVSDGVLEARNDRSWFKCSSNERFSTRSREWEGITNCSVQSKQFPSTTEATDDAANLSLSQVQKSYWLQEINCCGWWNAISA